MEGEEGGDGSMEGGIGIEGGIDRGRDRGRDSLYRPILLRVYTD